MSWMVETSAAFGSTRRGSRRSRPPRRPLGSAAPCVRRWLRRRGYCLWLLVMLLVAGVTIETFIIQPSSGPLRLPFIKDNLFPSLTNFWSDRDSNASTELQQDLRHLQRDLELPHQPQKPQLPKKKKSQHVCRPKNHIVFLKTHKTGSSTILNILYRYGEARNLTFALPRNKHNQLSYPLTFDAKFVEGVQNGRKTSFHIMCNHMRFRKSEVVKLMPKDSVYFSILRHPVAMMDSLYVYYRGLAVFRGFKSLDDIGEKSWASSAMMNPYGHNNLAYDFGFSNNMTADAESLEETVASVIATMERDFHFILINEYFDESMILLKHALCWSLEDVVSFRLNSRSDKTRKPVSEETAEKIKRWNALDWRIYQHFNQTFWARAEREVGLEELSKEVGQLRDLQAQLTSLCLKDGQPVNPSQVKEAQLRPFQSGSAVIQGYNLNTDLKNSTRTKCQRLITPELQYTTLLYDKQFP